jgi:hypothetical protein
MKMLIIALVLQASSPTVGETAPTTPAAQPPAAGQMDCHYDQAAHARMCTNAQGELLRCRRERVMGSRMPVTVCTTAAEDAAMERDSRDALQKYQTVATPGVG